MFYHVSTLANIHKTCPASILNPPTSKAWKSSKAAWHCVYEKRLKLNLRQLGSKRPGKFLDDLYFPVCTSTYFIHFYPKMTDNKTAEGKYLLKEAMARPATLSNQGLHVQMMQLCIGLRAKSHETYWLGMVCSGW